MPGVYHPTHSSPTLHLRSLITFIRYFLHFLFLTFLYSNPLLVSLCVVSFVGEVSMVEVVKGGANSVSGTGGMWATGHVRAQ